MQQPCSLRSHTGICAVTAQSFIKDCWSSTLLSAIMPWKIKPQTTFICKFFVQWMVQVLQFEHQVVVNNQVLAFARAVLLCFSVFSTQNKREDIFNYVANTDNQEKTQPICKREYLALFNPVESSNEAVSVRSVSPVLVSPSEKWQQLRLSAQVATLSKSTTTEGKLPHGSLTLYGWQNHRTVTAACICSALSIWTFTNSSHELCTWEKPVEFLNAAYNTSFSLSNYCGKSERES